MNIYIPTDTTINKSLYCLCKTNAANFRTFYRIFQSLEPSATSTSSKTCLLFPKMNIHIMSFFKHPIEIKTCVCPSD